VQAARGAHLGGNTKTNDSKRVAARNICDFFGVETLHKWTAVKKQKSLHWRSQP
jgi:hypothetical protein